MSSVERLLKPSIKRFGCFCVQYRCDGDGGTITTIFGGLATLQIVHSALLPQSMLGDESPAIKPHPINGVGEANWMNPVQLCRPNHSCPGGQTVILDAV